MPLDAEAAAESGDPIAPLVRMRGHAPTSPFAGGGARARPLHRRRTGGRLDDPRVTRHLGDPRRFRVRELRGRGQHGGHAVRAPGGGGAGAGGRRPGRGQRERTADRRHRASADRRPAARRERRRGRDGRRVRAAAGVLGRRRHARGRWPASARPEGRLGRLALPRARGRARRQDADPARRRHPDLRAAVCPLRDGRRDRHRAPSQRAGRARRRPGRTGRRVPGSGRRWTGHGLGGRLVRGLRGGRRARRRHRRGRVRPQAAADPAPGRRSPQWRPWVAAAACAEGGTRERRRHAARQPPDGRRAVPDDPDRRPDTSGARGSYGCGWPRRQPASGSWTGAGACARRSSWRSSPAVRGWSS